jgi:hypothetical protein
MATEAARPASSRPSPERNPAVGRFQAIRGVALGNLSDNPLSPGSWLTAGAADTDGRRKRETEVGAMSVQQGNDGEQLPLEVADIKELMPSDWHGIQVSVSSYRAFCLRPEELSPPTLVDLLGVRIQLSWGAAPYFKSRLWMEPRINGDVYVRVEADGFQHAPPGPFVMLMTPTEGDTRSRFRSVVALLRLALGRNIAVEPLGDLTYIASTPNATATEPPFRSPSWDPAPDLALERFRLISELQVALAALDLELSNRVALSLQWYFRASSEISGIDGFLMHWFALDVLAMPRSSGLVALERQLAKIYEVDRKELRAQFRLHRLLGIRDDIVHEGHQPAVHIHALEYLGAVYWDLLLDNLGLAPRRAAGTFLEAHNIDDWFPEPRPRKSATRAQRH